MKKKFIIILIIQTILMGVIFIYALLQKMTADIHYEKASETEIELEKVKGELENCLNNSQGTK